jgi:hypothetical protein
MCFVHVSSVTEATIMQNVYSTIATISKREREKKELCVSQLLCYRSVAQRLPIVYISLKKTSLSFAVWWEVVVDVVVAVRMAKCPS